MGALAGRKPAPGRGRREWYPKRERKPRNLKKYSGVLHPAFRLTA